MILIVAGTVGILDEPLERGIFFGVVGVFSLLLGTATAAVSLAKNHNGRADALLLAELEAEHRNEHRVEIFEEVDRQAEEMREAGELLDEDFPDEYFERRLAIFTEAYRRSAEKDWRPGEPDLVGMYLFDRMSPEKQKQLLREVICDIDKKPDGDVS